MKTTRIALVQTHWPGQRDSLIETYHQLAKEATSQQVDILCLPEFSISPYFPGTTDPAGFNWAEPLQGGPSEQLFADLACTHNLTVIGSLYEKLPHVDLDSSPLGKTAELVESRPPSIPPKGREASSP
ncbi:nitrilase-related carbon-nitrogen hydrolase, partial [Anaerolineales bacterium HSG25]|nr:nitrilase-related carbon-nitrogen hydrolase [Anaerolineales bacterium HSG25]